MATKTKRTEKWMICDWTGAVMFEKKFATFEDAEDELSSFLGDSYETDREEYEIIMADGVRDGRYLDPRDYRAGRKIAVREVSNE